MFSGVFCPLPEVSKQRDVHITYKQNVTYIGTIIKFGNLTLGTKSHVFALNIAEDIYCLIIITLL